MNMCKKSLSGLLIMALCFTMVFMDYNIANAQTARGKVKEIKFVLPSSYTIEENTNGQWSLDENGEYYYRYNLGGFEQESFVALYENGDEVTYSCYSGKGDAYWSLYDYRGSDGSEVRVYNPLRSNQAEHHFTVGGNNYFIFQFEGIKVKVPVTVTPKEQQETNVEKIEYKPTIKKIGYDDSMIAYNAEKDMEQMFFYSDNCYQNKNDKLTVTDKDGITKEYTLSVDGNTGDYCFSTTEGEKLDGDVKFSDDQELNEWGYDKDCYYIVEYGGAFTKVPITVEENDVKSISIFVGDDSEIPELSCDMDVYADGTDDSGMGVIDGIIVTKKDGTKETIKYKYSNGSGEEYSSRQYDESGFYDENDNLVDLDIRHKNMKKSGQWYVYYHGVTCQIPTVHHNTSWKVKQKPTCKEKGLYEKTCTCGQFIERKEIPIDASAHKFITYKYNNDAKVGVDGTETAICENGCGAIDTKTKPGTALPNGSSSGGGGWIPPTIEQKPNISEGIGYSTFIGDNNKTVLIIVDDGYELADVKVNDVSKGVLKKVTNLKQTDKVEIFVTSKNEKIQQIKEKLETVSKKNFQTRSSQVKMKNGKKAIKISLLNQSNIEFDGIEIFRSLKKNSGYGSKPIYTTKSGTYYNTAIKKGKKYYYKARGYIEYEGIKYYSPWSAKAWRTIK